MISRRSFFKKSSLGGAAAFALIHRNAFGHVSHNDSELYQHCRGLVHTWGEKLLSLQIADKDNADYGGIICPSYHIVHGRIGDTIYPFSYLADVTNQSTYADAIVLLFRWMERHVSQDDGSWLNETTPGSWKGTTVFSIIALAEALKYHDRVMDKQFQSMIRDRLKKAGEFVAANFSTEYGNINYPIAGSYALSLLGEILDEQKFRAKAKALATQSLKFISPKDKFIYGEGNHDHVPSKKGCYAIDLGYNVEESLPSLVQYALLTEDEEVLNVAVQSLRTHMEFMLPDGGWDNSWGTRNYKWTYWGSRTSDGCQPGYALLADRDERFYAVALRNTQLLQQCTRNGLLTGGPHYADRGIPTSVHHTFVHIKALTTVLDHGDIYGKQHNVKLPRERIYGGRFFQDIDTWLISKGKFRATVTGYDCEYKDTTDGHTSGGALSLLWHEHAGIIFSASMNTYQLIEAHNMQVDEEGESMCITPRVEIQKDGTRYMNISDLGAKISTIKSDSFTVNVSSKLVDKHQQSPSSGEIRMESSYIFFSDRVRLTWRTYETVSAILPVVAKSTESLEIISSKEIVVRKEKCTLRVSSNVPIVLLPAMRDRVFNFVPGLEAIPLVCNGNHIIIDIAVE